MNNPNQSARSLGSSSVDSIGSTATKRQAGRHSKVCILNDNDARLLVHAGIEHRCNSRRHHHVAKSTVEALVRDGEMVWLGKHHKVATYRNARAWAKVYNRNQAGEVLSCGMQLVGNHR
jgi:hypothetical protein